MNADNFSDSKLILDIEKGDNGGYTIRSEKFTLTAGMDLSLAGETAVSLDFKDPCSRKFNLGPLQGIVETDIHGTDGIEVRRDFFICKHKKFIALRLVIENKRTSPIQLESACLLRAEGSNALQFKNIARPCDWYVLRMSRQKNDIPGVYRPGTVDDNFLDAVTNTEKVEAGMGLTKEALGSSSTATHSEPLIIIHDERTGTNTFFGVLGQKDHLTDIELQTSTHGKELESFKVRCEFDNVQIDPGETINTHWFYITTGDNERELLDEYADIAACIHNIPVPPPPKTIYCSWYFYGSEFLLEDLEENLEYLKKNPIPIDSFMLDHGWMDTRGTWNANEKFPNGMKDVADKIRDAGMTPGIWTCPFVIQTDSPILEKYPDLIAMDGNGEPSLFSKQYIVDPSSPNAEEYFNEFYGRLRSWGFTLHKLDFLRALVTNDDIKFSDPKMNRARAYRRCLELVRNALGQDAYIAACGGVFDAGNFNLIDSYRLGADVKSYWYSPDKERALGHLIKIKQCTFRNYTSRFWHTDPDALMLRLRHEPFRGNEVLKHLSVGSFTDEEAFTTTVLQFLTGGIVLVSERFVELQEERRALLRHVIPPLAPPARIIDIHSPNCPCTFVTEIEHGPMGKWWILTLGNWEDESVEKRISIRDAGLPPETKEYACFEFRTQEYLGLKSIEDDICIEVPAHGCRVIRLTPFDGTGPVVLGTDLHLSGGCEICRVETTRDTIKGEIDTKWNYPVTITAGFPEGDKLRIEKATVASGHKEFTIQACFS